MADAFGKHPIDRHALTGWKPPSLAAIARRRNHLISDIARIPKPRVNLTPQDAAILTVGIGCWIVMVMKGPAKYADSYELSVPEQPSKEINEDGRRSSESDKKYQLKA